MKQNIVKNKVSAVEKEQNFIKKYAIEIVSLLLYSFLLLIVMYYHEPWLDEAQSWLIARDASLADLFMSITHYEGHPPLWFMILMIFAKSGIPFEIGLKFVNYVIVNVSIAILIFKAPFSRFFRCTIPFSYFFFYQYGVISRSYSLMMLGFILCAMFYKNRNENPFKLTASLMLLCSTSAYGIVISFGIVLVWIFENLFKSYVPRKFIRINRNLLTSWAFLLVFNIMILIIIYPFKDTFAIEAYEKSNISIFKSVYMFLATPMEVLFTNSIYTDYHKLGNFYYIFILISGYLFNVFLLLINIKYKKSGLFLVPYFLFSVFSSTVYFSPHHYGIIALFYVCIIWCCFDENSNNTRNIKNFKQNINQKLWSNFAKAAFSISIIISIYWSASSAIFDIKNNYGNGREISEFISENNLDKLNIYVAWYPISEDDYGNEIYDFNLACGIPALAYFNENIFCNFNQKSYDKCYLLHKVNRDTSYIKNLINNKKPEALLISNRMNYTFGDYIIIKDYALVKVIKANMIWKDSNNKFEDFIYIRKDIMKNYPELKEISTPQEY